MKWFELDPIRFELEINLLRRHHRGCKLIKQNGKYSIQFQVRTTKRSYQLEAIFPDTFPNSPMVVQVKHPKITDFPPHYFGKSGGLCIYGSGNFGPETTAKVYIDWAKQWIKCYEQWQITGVWPVTNGR